MAAEFSYHGDALFCEHVPLDQIANEYGTPAYVYSKAAIRSRFHQYEDALAGLPHRVCYAVKANSNLAVLATLAAEGAGFDIVSGGELYRVLAAGGDPSSVVFSGVGKTAAEIRYALEQNIHSFNCESETEIELISTIAASSGQTACIAIRVNPDVDAVTHPYISTGLREHKFGIDIARAEEIYARVARLPGIEVNGVSCHIGSQLLSVEPLLEAADKVLALVQRLRGAGLTIRDLDLGGGLGVPYRSEERRVPVDTFIQRLRGKLQDSNLTLMLEPGRSIVAEAGVLLSRVLLVKTNDDKTFVIVDAAMNDLIRPALYQAHHEILPARRVKGPVQPVKADVVGPVCESGDFFARGRDLPPLAPGDLVAIKTAGAYGFVLASNYNSRPRPCELLVDGARIHVARRRETFPDLIRGESSATGAASGIKQTECEHDQSPCDICTGSS
ncbi:MAG: diaminopimelate decarboxylase [Acidobacteriaceae bacterium]|nr:diaminopimelate decarboxylase [Acidobacteriaceae bacterium]